MVRVDLRTLKLMPKEENARFMRSATFSRLVENLRTDGVLTSTPLVYRGLVLSGNHRVEAAIAAGIFEEDVKEILSEITPERARAIQLAHNEITGEDDPGVLAELYKQLDFTWKAYSGLSDERVGLVQKLDITALSLGSPEYQELSFLFLPEDMKTAVRAIEAISRKLDRSVPVFLGHLSDYETFFQALVETKKVRGVHNHSIALRMMAEIALTVLEQEGAELAVKKAEERAAKERTKAENASKQKTKKTKANTAQAGT